MDGLRESLIKRMASAVKNMSQEEAIENIEFGYGLYLDQLAEKGEFLLSQNNRHEWVRKDTTKMSDQNNWYAYVMEVNFTYAFEQAGYHVQNSKKRLDGKSSDIDIVYTYENGIEVRMECVRIQRKKNAKGFTDLLRHIQDELRHKTIQGGDPHKFPPAEENAVHLIVADVTGYQLDYGDTASILWGHNYVDPRIALHLPGLCDLGNPFGPEFKKEFEENRYLRERIHGVLFVQNSTGYNNIFAPEYEGMSMSNPELLMNSRQKEAVSNHPSILKDLIVKWCVGLDLIKSDGSVESLAGT